MKPVLAYLILAGVFLILDIIWLGYVAFDFYRRGFGDLLAENVNMAAAVGFYLIYTIGLFVFVVQPALATDDWKTAALMGAVFGFIAYATYDLTNLATLKGFPLNVAIVDMAWGATISAITAAASVFLVNRLVA